MNITISKPYAISERGRRQNNEDSVFPLPEQINDEQKLFLVCDGVGGAEKGEVASSLACESISTFFSTFSSESLTDEFIQKAIQYTEVCFDSYLREHPEATGMATTLALVYITSEGVWIAHIGDSRVYHLRGGNILYQTEDHSLVNSWVKLGKISSREALNHPQRHVITQAIQGSDSPMKADTVLLSDIQAGDYLFLCTDGMLEQLDNEKISAIFKQNSSCVAIKDAMMDSCVGKTRDNFSFYIIPIQKVQNGTSLRQNILSFLYSFI